MLHVVILLKQVIEIVPNPNLQSPAAKETAGTAVQPSPQVQKSATHSLPQQPAQQSAHMPIVPVHQISREEHQILAQARELVKHQEQHRARMEQHRIDPAHMEKVVQQRLEQAQREKQQVHQQQQQHQHIQRGRESREVQHQQPAAQPRADPPPHMRAEQMPSYAMVEGFGAQVSPHARVSTPQQHQEIHTVEKKGKIIA